MTESHRPKTDTQVQNQDQNRVGGGESVHSPLELLRIAVRLCLSPVTGENTEATATRVQTSKRRGGEGQHTRRGNLVTKGKCCRCRSAWLRKASVADVGVGSSRARFGGSSSHKKGRCIYPLHICVCQRKALQLCSVVRFRFLQLRQCGGGWQLGGARRRTSKCFHRIRSMKR